MVVPCPLNLEPSDDCNCIFVTPFELRPSAQRDSLASSLFRNRFTPEVFALVDAFREELNANSVQMNEFTYQMAFITILLNTYRKYQTESQSNVFVDQNLLVLTFFWLKWMASQSVWHSLYLSRPIACSL